MRGRKRETASRTSQPAGSERREGEEAQARSEGWGRGRGPGAPLHEKSQSRQMERAGDSHAGRRVQGEPGPEAEVGGGGGQGTGAKEGGRRLEQSSGHTKWKRSSGVKERRGSRHLGDGGASRETWASQHQAHARRHTHTRSAPTRLAWPVLSKTSVVVQPPPLKPPPPGPRSPSPSPAPTALALPALGGGCCSSEAPRACTGEGAARVSYLEGGEVGVAHDPVDGLEVGQVPLRHVHQLGGVYLVGEVGRAVLQRGRVFILVAVFLGTGTQASLGPPLGPPGCLRPAGPPPLPPAPLQCSAEGPGA